MKTVYAVSEGQRFNTDESLTVVSCFSCHMKYAIPTSLYESAIAWPGTQSNGWKLTCPLGHEWWFTGQNLTQKVEEANRRAGYLAAERDQALARARAALARARAEKAAKTRIKNSRSRERQRVGHGVCPCCNRSFANLARHMAGQHPEHAASTEPS